MSEPIWKIETLSYLGVVYIRLGGKFYTQFRLQTQLADIYNITIENAFNKILFFDNSVLFMGDGKTLINKNSLINPKYDTLIAIPKFLYDFELPFLIISDNDSIIGHIIFFDEDSYTDINLWGDDFHG